MGNCFSVHVSGGDALVGRCWDCIALRCNNLPQLRSNLQKLCNERDSLRALKDQVKQRVANQQVPQMKQLELVRVWVSKVEDKIAEVDRLIIQGENEKNNLCCGGYCSTTCCSSYTLATMIAESLEDVIALKERGNFEEVVERVPLEPVVERPSEPAVGQESTREKVWNWLMGEDSGIIGIYGMGGIGKTTLLTEINNRFLKSPHHFDFMIWLVASQNLRLESVQEEIARQVGLSEDPRWKEKQFFEKVTVIHEVLRKKKFVLLIDDLWDRVELKDIGVPPPNKQSESKIVFTTRSVEVCGKMEAHKSILLDPLPWREAWQLFQEKVGRETLDADIDIPGLAKDVAKECGGLPLALVTVGRAMAHRKTPQEWRRAVEILKTSAATFRGMADNIFPKLKFSYDNLPGEKVKSCLLYCSLFPEDHWIPKDELIQKWICESFWDDDFSETDPVNEGYDILATLVRACLLEDKGEHVKMHDTIRDMCLWIACEVEKEKENYFVRTATGSKMALNVGKWTDVKRISLMQNNIEQLKEIPKTPSLLTLLLSYNGRLKMIGDGFFRYMKGLRVLDLSNTGLTVFPTGITDLVSLCYLNISGTQIVELPWELTKLKKLKYFNLEFIGSLKVVPKETVSSLRSLQVLRMVGCNFVLDRSMLKELESLADLKDLSITIDNDLVFLYQLLRSCTLSSCIKYLEIRAIGLTSSSTVLEPDTQMEKFGESFGSLHKSLGNICFGNLQKVEISSCRFYLKDLTWLILAPNLTELKANSVSRLEEIISAAKLGEVMDQHEDLNVFAKLEVLSLEELPRLKSIWVKPLLFPSLNKISICGCSMLKKLPLSSESAKGRKLVIEGMKYWWDALEWEDDAALTTFATYYKELPSAFSFDDFTSECLNGSAFFPYFSDENPDACSVQ